MTHHDESSLNMQLYEKGSFAPAFTKEYSCSYDRHAFIKLDMPNKLKNGIDVQDFDTIEPITLSSWDDTIEPITLSSWDRMALVKKFEGALSVKGNAVVEALEGKRVEAYMTGLRAFADECGLTVKKLDEKLERTLLHSYRKVWPSFVLCP
ncbi:E3 UFM1-protein ligase 1 homolog isoform X3 [Helianthus annuus]|uniref:E3 UFM1-protein ligase 1 homolog isoform X3 n=1 Tax=Helianthus annuus TaxID=4232 RepID=UPI000B8FDF38|nr:E3 UFM1-protein ligase 1 homolog isoform X3 [Helianthus annuus]